MQIVSDGEQSALRCSFPVIHLSRCWEVENYKELRPPATGKTGRAHMLCLGLGLEDCAPLKGNPKATVVIRWDEKTGLLMEGVYTNYLPGTPRAGF
jgi:hypothetical protein